jgi:hypothetical protein
MSDKSKKTIEQFKEDIRRMRDEWKKIRADKLMRKDEIESPGYDRGNIRKDKIFKKLRKEQDGISKLIRHAEKRLNRELSKESRSSTE